MSYGCCATCPGGLTALFEVRDDAGALRAICRVCRGKVARLDFENMKYSRRGMVRTTPPAPSSARIYFLPRGGPAVLSRYGVERRRA